MAPWPIAQSRGRQNVCCVTTRCRNLGDVRCLQRRWDAAPARTLLLGVLGFGRIVLTPLGLPPRCLPAPQQAQAFGVLAITLVPAPRLVLAATALAQAEPWPRLSRTGTAAAVWLIMTTAHGSAISQGTARGERAIVLLGRFSNQEADGQSIRLCMNQTAKETA